MHLTECGVCSAHFALSIGPFLFRTHHGMDPEPAPINWEDYEDDGDAEFPDVDPAILDLEAVQEQDGVLVPAWVIHLRSSGGFDAMNKNHKGSQALRAKIADAGDLFERTHDICQYIKSRGMDIPTFLYAISGASGDGKDNKSLAYQRGFLLGHPDFCVIMDALDRHAARTARQRKTTTNPVRDAAVACMKRVVDQELSALKPVMRMDARDLSEESFLAIDIDEIMTETKAKAPRMWDFMTHSAETNTQRKHNKLKTPDYVSLPHHISHTYAYIFFKLVTFFLCAIMFHRSPTYGRVIKLLTFFLCSCQLAAKAYDMLNRFSLTLSQNWVLNAKSVVAKKSEQRMREEMKLYDIVIGSDNINISFSVQEQTLFNKSHFASGVATTVYIIKSPDPVRIDAVTFQVHYSAGYKQPLTFDDVINFELQYARPIYEHIVDLVLHILLDSPDFDLSKYRHHDSAYLKPPLPDMQLPYGREHRTLQYVLQTREQEVQSAEGNDKHLHWTLRYLILQKLQNRNARQACGLNIVLHWIGDQLTAQRIRTLKQQQTGENNSFNRFDFLDPLCAWLHLMMTYNNSLHSQLYGNEIKGDFGLAHIFKHLCRRHLHSPSTQGTFYHTLDMALKDITQGFRIVPICIQAGRNSGSHSVMQ
jgi:hypothetical protein